jgi:hypothetical protein
MLGYKNPWLVISTSNRHGARLGLLKAFNQQLHRFSHSPYDQPKSRFPCCPSGKAELNELSFRRPVPSDIVEVERGERGFSFRALFQAIILLLLAYAYAYQTWNFKLKDIT